MRGGLQHGTFHLVKKTPPPHVSFSQIDNWSKCGEAFRLEKVERVPSKPAWWFPGGSAVHTATEWYDKGQAGDRDAAELWADAFKLEVDKVAAGTDVPQEKWRAGGRASKDYPNKNDGAWWNDHGPAMVQGWIDFRNTTAWKLLEVEVEVNGTLGGAPVKAYIDRVFATPEGELAVVDLKAGSRAPESTYQLGWYADQYEQIFGQRPSVGAFWMARQNKMTEPESLHNWTRARLDRWVGKFMVAREHEIYIPKVSSSCRTCGVNDYCAAVGGSKAHEVEEA